MKTFSYFILWFVYSLIYFGLVLISISSKEKDTKRIVNIILITLTVIGLLIGFFSNDVD